MEILKVNGSIATIKNNIGGTITKKIKGINKKPYFSYGVDNEKIYFNIETLEILNTKKNTELKEFSFEVEHEDNRRVDGWALTKTTVKAKTYEDALFIVEKRFKKIFEISEC